jgi:type VI secretion system secreted protein Hcp
MSVFHRSNDGFESTEANRREVLLAAGGIAAATAIGTHTADKKGAAVPKIRMTIDAPGFAPFELLAWSWGASNSGTTHTGGGGGAGKANVQDLSITKYLDENSPRLLKALVMGQRFAGATLTWVGAKGSPTVTLDIDDVLITSVSTGGSGGEVRLTENMSVNFAQFTYSYNSVTMSYDIAENQI